MKKITIIGSGNMGSALAHGLCRSLDGDYLQLTMTGRREETREKVSQISEQIIYSTDNKQAIEDADYIVLAIKPWVVENIFTEIALSINWSKQVVVSMVAGLSIQEMQAMCGEYSNQGGFIRFIPNTAVAYGQSMSICCHAGLSQAQEKDFIELTQQLGELVVVSESQMQAATALCSCGIAFVYKFIQSCQDSALELGIGVTDGNKMIRQTIKGALTVLDQAEGDVQKEIYRVTTPGGMTIRGLNAMNEKGFSHAVHSALKAAIGKA